MPKLTVEFNDRINDILEQLAGEKRNNNSNVFAASCRSLQVS